MVATRLSRHAAFTRAAADRRSDSAVTLAALAHADGHDGGPAVGARDGGRLAHLALEPPLGQVGRAVEIGAGALGRRAPGEDGDPDDLGVVGDGGGEGDGDRRPG